MTYEEILTSQGIDLEYADLLKKCPRKKPVLGVALPISEAMQADIRDNPDDVTLVVRRKDGTVRIEHPKMPHYMHGPASILGLLGEFVTGDVQFCHKGGSWRGIEP
jgi:hypothetical protein